MIRHHQTVDIEDMAGFTLLILKNKSNCDNLITSENIKFLSNAAS